MSERSLSANLRANEQEQHSKAEPQGESAQHDEAHLDHCGMVNAVVVQRKIMVLPGEICLPNPSLSAALIISIKNSDLIFSHCCYGTTLCDLRLNNGFLGIAWIPCQFESS